jgi:hypothetical protein
MYFSGRNSCNCFAQYKDMGVQECSDYQDDLTDYLKAKVHVIDLCSNLNAPFTFYPRARSRTMAVEEWRRKMLEYD